MATTLNSVTIVDPYEFTIDYKSLAAAERSINGTLHVDYFSTSLDDNISIKIKWRLITSAQFSTLKTQIEGAIGNNRTLVLPDGLTFSVRLDPETAFVRLPVRSGGSILYNVECGFLVI
jgi:hypothetical protein